MPLLHPSNLKGAMRNHPLSSPLHRVCVYLIQVKALIACWFLFSRFCCRPVYMIKSRSMWEVNRGSVVFMTDFFKLLQSDHLFIFRLIAWAYYRFEGSESQLFFLGWLLYDCSYISVFSSTSILYTKPLLPCPRKACSFMFPAQVSVNRILLV